MGQQYDDQSRDSALQNRFTGYLQVALKHTKRKYSQRKLRREIHEFPTDFQTAQFAEDFITTPDGSSWGFFSHENIVLDEALASLTARERFILYERVLNGTEYSELAKVFGLRYNGIASAYHRIIIKLRKELEGGSK